VTLIVFRQPGANIIDTVDRIREALPSVEHRFPRNRHDDRSDRTTTIRASVSTVERTLELSIVLVIGVVFVFFATAGHTDSGGCGSGVSDRHLCVMYLCGYSLDNLSLMALTISTDCCGRRHRRDGEHHAAY